MAVPLKDFFMSKNFYLNTGFFLYLKPIIFPIGRNTIFMGLS